MTPKIKLLIPFTFFCFLFIAPCNGQKISLEEKIKEIDSLMYAQRVYIVIPKIDSLLAKEIPSSKELHLKTCKLITLVHIEKLETALNYANQLLRNKYLKGADLIATRLQKGLIFGSLNRLDEMKVELDFVKDYYNNPKITKDELYGEYLIRLATWYRAQSLNNEAATYSEEAIDFGNRKNYSNVEAVGLVLTALYKYTTKDKEYIQYRLRALKNLKKTGNFHAMGWTYAHLYHKYKNDKQVKLAFSYLDSSLLYSKKVKYFRSMASSYKILSDYYENEGNKGKALDYYKLFKMASDSSALRTESRKVEEIQSKYNFEKAEQLTKETEIKRKNTTYLLILICVILAITIVSLSITRQKNKRIKATEKEVNQKLKEKEFLLKELNHRVNNNLALILSLVKFQYYEIDEPKYKDKFQSLEHRIKTIAAAHEQLLYSNENLEGEDYDVQDYLSKITNALIEISTKNIQLNLDAKNINLNIDTMLPIGILINELMSNSLKHAVFKDKLIIDVLITLQQSNIEITYKDSGTTFKEKTNTKSLGISIINSMVKQLKGTINRKDSEYNITLQLKNSKNGNNE